MKDLYKHRLFWIPLGDVTGLLADDALTSRVRRADVTSRVRRADALTSRVNMCSVENTY